MICFPVLDNAVAIVMEEPPCLEIGIIRISHEDASGYIPWYTRGTMETRGEVGEHSIQMRCCLLGVGYRDIIRRTGH